MRFTIALIAVMAAASAAWAQQEPATPPTAGGGDIVVEGERPGPTPPADPRTTRERMRDIRAWDRCVMRAQHATADDPMRPELETPEDICRERLGMSDRLSVPISRLGER